MEISGSSFSCLHLWLLQKQLKLLAITMVANFIHSLYSIYHKLLAQIFVLIALYLGTIPLTELCRNRRWSRVCHSNKSPKPEQRKYIHYLRKRKRYPKNPNRKSIILRSTNATSLIEADRSLLENVQSWAAVCRNESIINAARLLFCSTFISLSCCTSHFYENESNEKKIF
jgi:hypothetical protein